MISDDLRGSFLSLLTNAWKISKTYEDYFKSYLEIYDLTKSEKDVILFLHHNPQYRTATDIVRFRSISKSLVSKSIERLIDRRYLEETENPLDRRSTFLHLTEKTSSIVSDLVKAQEEFLRELFKDVTREECLQLVAIHNKINDSMERGLKKDESCTKLRE